MLEGLDMWRRLGDPHYIALGLNFLITTLTQLGCYNDAIAFMHESIDLCEQSKNRWELGTAYRYLGLAIMAKGDFKEAQVHLRNSLEVFSNFTIDWDIALSNA